MSRWMIEKSLGGNRMSCADPYPFPEMLPGPRWTTPIRALGEGTGRSNPGRFLRWGEPGARYPDLRAARSRNPERKLHLRRDGLEEPESKRLRDGLRPGPGSEPQLDVVNKRLHGPLRVAELFSDRPCVAPLGKQGQHL
jgi:hypothetical protein